jgi:hypothetical protein
MVERDILAKSPTATLLFRLIVAGDGHPEFAIRNCIKGGLGIPVCLSAVLATLTIHDPVSHCDMPEKDSSAIPSWTYSFSSGLALTASLG